MVVADDGAGLDPERVRATAVRRGLLGAEAAAQLTDAQAARLVFQPGFSTRESVTSISGRGVGLDVVQSTATRLQGAVHIHFTPGQGTRFTVDLPLTLAAALGLLVRTGTSVVALPSDAVKRVLRLPPADVGTVAGRVLVKVDQEQLPFHTLSEAIGMRAPAHRAGRGAGAARGAARAGRGPRGVRDRRDRGAAGDRGAPAGAPPQRRAPPGGRQRAGRRAAGAGAQRPRAAARAAAPELKGGAQLQRPRVLVCDDSLTTRFAMKALLEIAGYPVVTAADGEEAFEVLERTRCQLVVSDWQMPRLDGVGLARRIKAHPTLARTPIILVTSLDSPEDRAAGLEAGADGYIVKKDVQRGKLLDLVRQLLPSA